MEFLKPKIKANINLSMSAHEFCEFLKVTIDCLNNQIFENIKIYSDKQAESVRKKFMNI
jgi:hypothetical protein